MTILEKQHLDTCKELETIKEKLIDLESKYTSESDKVKHLVEIVAQKEIELNEVYLLVNFRCIFMFKFSF